MLLKPLLLAKLYTEASKLGFSIFCKMETKINKCRFSKQVIETINIVTNHDLIVSYISN